MVLLKLPVKVAWVIHSTINSPEHTHACPRAYPLTTHEQHVGRKDESQ